MRLYDFVTPVLLGWGLSFVSVMIGSWIIVRAFRSEDRGFINKVLLSMVVRMLAIVISIFLLIFFLKIDGIILAATLFFFYFIFLVLEINFLSGATNKIK